MGTFSGKISAKFTPPKTWVLNEALSFTTDKITPAEGEMLELVGANIENESNTKVTCEEGMKTDLASVPRICWAFIAPWDVARAAVIHDHLYATLREYYNSGLIDKKIWKKARAISDKIFLLVCTQPNRPFQNGKSIRHIILFAYVEAGQHLKIVTN